MLKHILTIGVLTVIVFCLSGCGSEDNPATANQVAVKTEAPPQLPLGSTPRNQIWSSKPGSGKKAGSYSHKHCFAEGPQD